MPETSPVEDSSKNEEVTEPWGVGVIGADI